MEKLAGTQNLGPVSSAVVEKPERMHADPEVCLKCTTPYTTSQHASNPTKRTQTIPPPPHTTAPDELVSKDFTGGYSTDAACRRADTSPRFAKHLEMQAHRAVVAQAHGLVGVLRALGLVAQLHRLRVAEVRVLGEVAARGGAQRLLRRLGRQVAVLGPGCRRRVRGSRLGRVCHLEARPTQTHALVPALKETPARSRRNWAGLGEGRGNRFGNATGCAGQTGRREVGKISVKVCCCCHVVIFAGDVSVWSATNH